MAHLTHLMMMAETTVVIMEETMEETMEEF